MNEYTYEDFIRALDADGRSVLDGIHAHISANAPLYRAVDVKPTNPQNTDWTMAYRKKPKVGKAVCTLWANDGKLSVRFAFLTSMTHAFLLRKGEFSKKTVATVQRQSLCSVSAGCRSYGGHAVCPYRQHFWVGDRLLRACPYPWIDFHELEPGDLDDIERLLDLQMQHMTQDARDIKGGTYAEENAARCAPVEIVCLPEQRLDVDTFQFSDHVKKPARLDKYAKLYHLVPMGEGEGLWYYDSSLAACGGDVSGLMYASNAVPDGRYARVRIADPMTFSARRAFNVVCQAIEDRGERVRGIDLDGARTACLVKFYIEQGMEMMAVFVPLV